MVITMRQEIKTFLVTGATIASLIGGSMWGIPQYKVYSQEMAGTATLARAAQERQVLIEKARAEKEAAQLQADAIAIVGQAYAEYPDYRNALFLESLGEVLENGNIDQIMYLPTEAGIPIS